MGSGGISTSRLGGATATSTLDAGRVIADALAIGARRSGRFMPKSQNRHSMKGRSMKTTKKQLDLLEKWALVPEGTNVIVTKDRGEEVSTKTRSMAWLLPSHVAVIMLEGISGGYSLERVRLA